MKKYRATRPFIAFGKTANPGDIVWLTREQADALRAEACVEPYEVKVDPPIDPKPEQAVEQKVELPSASPPARRSRKRTSRSRSRKPTS